MVINFLKEVEILVPRYLLFQQFAGKMDAALYGTQWFLKDI